MRMGRVGDRITDDDRAWMEAIDVATDGMLSAGLTNAKADGVELLAFLHRPRPETEDDGGRESL
jgi:hypothetical protein